MTRKWILSLGLIAGLLLFGTAQALLTAAVDWSVMAGGGGQDTVGSVVLDHTVGQWMVGSDTSGATELTAGFWYGRKCYSLTTAVDPVAGGTVTLDPAPNCGSQYRSGTVVNVTAVSNSGYVFDHWSGDASGSVNPAQVTMNGNKSVTAHFEETTQPCYTLTTAVSPGGSGVVNAQPAPNCGAQYESGTVVTLTAVANGGYVFDHWSGDAGGSVNPVQVTMNGDRSATAHFGVACHSLATAANPPAGGSVLVDPPPNCGGQYTHGTVVTLTAVANTGYVFDHWSGDASGSVNPLSGPITADTSITAHFQLTCHSLVTAADPPAGGSVLVDPLPNCGGQYTYGTVVTLTAVADSGYVFHHWSGDASGSDNPISGPITADTNITAHFQETTQPCYTLTTAADPPQGGSVQVEPAPNCGSQYLQGTIVTLTAFANGGYTFSHWSGDAGGSNNPLSGPITADTSITAHFRPGLMLYLPVVVNSNVP